MKFPSFVILRACLLLLPLGLLPAGAFAVSLGDELILSRLGDPVEVEVEVLQWEDMDLERVQISAASREEYEVFKLTWLPVLEHLNFNLVGPDLDGNVRVLISSRDPLDEPFLELLLVLRWPGGSLRREYVLLFDPPGTSLAIAQPQRAASDVSTSGAMTPTPALVMNVPQLPVEEETSSTPAVPAPQHDNPVPVADTGLRDDNPVPVADAGLQAEPAPIAEATPQLVALVAPQPVEPPPADPAVVTTVADTAAPVAATDVELPLVEASNVVTPSIADTETVMPPAVEDVEEPSVVTPPPADDAISTAASSPQSPAVAAIADEPAPVVAESSTASVQPPESSPDARTQVAIEVETLAPRRDAAPIDATRRTYLVRAGDSLWNIARQFRPAGAGENLYQMLLGIHDLNRNSFINGNISLLKTNALLQMPTEADIAAIDATTAQAEFDRRWDSGTQRFDAVQRGEAIPLFVSEVPEEAPMLPIEPQLPPGTELSPATVDDDGLIMVSAGNAAPPLQLALADEAALADESADDALQMNAADAEPAPGLQADEAGAEPQPAQQIDTSIAEDGAAVTTTDGSALPAVPAQAAAGASRVVVTAELESELAAMRARRESAEALARQLQDSLQRAQAERAAETALLSPRNLPLAGGALALLLALIAGVVFLLKLAGEVRAARIGADIARVLPRSGEQSFDRAPVASPRNAPPRTEPTLTEPDTEPPRASLPGDVADAAQIEVVELEAPGANATAAASGGDADDLFARMDDMLGAAKKSPQK